MLILWFFTCLIGMLVALLPELGFVLSLIWGVSLIIGARYVEWWQLGLLVFTGLALYFFGLELNHFCALLLLLSPIFLMAAWFNRGGDYHRVRRMGVLTAVLATLIYLGVAFPLLEGVNYSTYRSQVEAQIQEFLDDPSQQPLWDLYAAQGLDQATIQASLQQSFVFVSHLIPALNAMMFAGYALLTLALSRLLARLRKWDILNKTPFIEERMPWPAVWIFIAGLALTLLGWGNYNYLFYSGMNVLIFLLPFCCYYGLADFVRRLRPVAVGLRVAVIVGMSLLFLIMPPSVVLVIAMAGLLTTLFDRGEKEKKEERIR